MLMLISPPYHYTVWPAILQDLPDNPHQEPPIKRVVPQTSLQRAAQTKARNRKRQGKGHR